MNRFYIIMNIKGFSPTAKQGGLVCGPIFVFSRDDFPLVTDPPLAEIIA